MRAIRTERSNFTYVGPEPDIGDLPCQRADGAVFAVYELDDAERTMIANGAQVQLAVFTEPIPPVSLRLVNEREAPSDDDLRCEHCAFLCRRDRGLERCGWCGGRLVESLPAVPVAIDRPRRRRWRGNRYE